MKPVNRILLAFKDWEDRKQEMQPLLKNGHGDERTLLKLQLEHLQQARHRLQDTVRPDEQPFMALLRTSIVRLEKRLYPNWLQRHLLRFKNRFIDRPAYLRQQTQQRAANMETLKQQLRDTGLGAIAGKLEEHLDPDHRQVCLPLNCQLGDGKQLNLDGHFHKDVYGNFSLDRLDGHLSQHGETIRSQAFDLKNWPGLKTNQALALLEGRPLKQIYTDATGQENQRWVELGEKGPQYYAAEHFDLRDTLAAFPQLTRNREELISYLENGQQIPTHWKQDGQFQNISVQCDPANRTLRFFDAKQKPLTAEQLSLKAKQLAKTNKPEAPAQHHRKRLVNGHRIG